MCDFFQVKFNQILIIIFNFEKYLLPKDTNKIYVIINKFFKARNMHYFKNIKQNFDLPNNLPRNLDFRIDDLRL